jgi:hypothetical protein
MSLLKKINQQGNVMKKHLLAIATVGGLLFTGCASQQENINPFKTPIINIDKKTESIVVIRSDIPKSGDCSTIKTNNNLTTQEYVTKSGEIKNYTTGESLLVEACGKKEVVVFNITTVTKALVNSSK